MEILSFIGIILGIALFVFLSFKGINLFFNAVVAAICMIVFARLPLIETLTDGYMTGMAGFLKGYMFIFALGSLFGKVLEDSGAVRRVAQSLAGLTRYSKKAQKFWAVMILPVFYVILSYVGISGFVVVFTVVAIGRDLFRECDVPWSFYCYGSAGIFLAIILTGSVQPANLILTSGFNVPVTASPLLSIVMFAAGIVTLMLLLWLDLRKTEKKGEGFYPTGEAIMKLQVADTEQEEKPCNLFLSVLALFSPMIAIVAFKLHVIIALTIGIALSFVFFFKRIKNPIATLSGGIASSGLPLINVAATSGLASIITLTPGFAVVTNALNGLPDVFAGVGIISFICAVVASSSSGIPSVMPLVIEKMASAGIGADVAARLGTAGTFTFMTPHNPGIVNAVSLTKLSYTKAAWLYFKTTFFPGLAAVVVGIIMVLTSIIR